MRQTTYLVVVAFFCLTTSFNAAQAQIWSGLGSVFEQLNATERENFAEELDDLEDSWDYDDVDLDDIVDDLLNGISIYDPEEPVGPMPIVWSNSQDNLAAMLSAASSSPGVCINSVVSDLNAYVNGLSVSSTTKRAITTRLEIAASKFCSGTSPEIIIGYLENVIDYANRRLPAAAAAYLTGQLNDLAAALNSGAVVCCEPGSDPPAGSGLSMLDSLAVMDEFDRINQIWDSNLDGLNTALEEYDGSASFAPGPAEDAVEEFEESEGEWEDNFEYLENTFWHDLNNTGPRGPGNAEETLDVFFGSMFDFELAFGKEFADARYYDESYSVAASVIRLASVPSFSFDWEARWSITCSFFDVDEQFGDSGSLLDGFNGLMGNAQFALMYNPLIGSTPDGVIRLYSSLGIEAATYVPPHVRPYQPSSLDNVGNTTGYGPQIGAGAIIKVGPASLYAYGTLSAGDVAEGYSYRFRHQAVNAGIRYGDLVNVLYTYGSARWAPHQHKYLEYHRVTIGIILDELSR